jgi:predicted nucleic acid-binding protein
MILVDTSVLIGYLKGQSGPKIELFEKALSRGIPFGISAYTYQEILQGARDEKELEQLREYLSTQTIYFFSELLKAYDNAALLYFRLRRHGVTLRGIIDVLIALTAIENELFLLHDDRDFDLMARFAPKLKLLKSL